MHAPLASTPQSSRFIAAPVNLNLGSIGRLKPHQSGRAGGPLYTSGDQCAVVTCAHTGLPRPAPDPKCHLLPVPECPNLLVMGTIHHEVAYYIIVNVAERPAFTAIAEAVKQQRVELVFTAERSLPWWSAMRFDEETLKKLSVELQARKDAWRQANDLWRDRLGMLLIDLPFRLSHHNTAARHGEVADTPNSAQPRRPWHSSWRYKV